MSFACKVKHSGQPGVIALISEAAYLLIYLISFIGPSCFKHIKKDLLILIYSYWLESVLIEICLFTF